MDTLKSETGENYYGLFHESFSPLTLHVDTGFDENAIIYKQVITPLSPIGDTIILKKRWYIFINLWMITKKSESLKF